MLDGDMVFEVRHKLVGKDRIKCVTKKLYIQYFKAENRN